MYKKIESYNKKYLKNRINSVYIKCVYITIYKDILDKNFSLKDMGICKKKYIEVRGPIQKLQYLIMSSRKM